MKKTSRSKIRKKMMTRIIRMRHRSMESNRMISRLISKLTRKRCSKSRQLYLLNSSSKMKNKREQAHPIGQVLNKTDTTTPIFKSLLSTSKELQLLHLEIIKFLVFIDLIHIDPQIIKIRAKIRNQESKDPRARKSNPHLPKNNLK